jgi:peroxisomal coenzyme A diphosphatase NUDT7
MSPPRSTILTSNSDLYKFHRPKLRVNDTPHPLKRESELYKPTLMYSIQPLPFLSRSLKNLSTHRIKRPAPPYPRACCAAVLVALFVGRAGDLYVLLSQQAPFLYPYRISYSQPHHNRRAKTLTSYAGDTALPGGRVDDEDKTIEDTAVRFDSIHPLC